MIAFDDDIAFTELSLRSAVFIKKIVIKVEQSASMKKVRDYLLSVQRMLVEDERFRSLIVYYDVDPQ